MAALARSVAIRASTAVVQRVDGWLLRYAAGVTRRANSVWPNAGRSLAVGEKIALAEAFYERRKVPCRFQLSPAACPPRCARSPRSCRFRPAPFVVSIERACW